MYGSTSRVAAVNPPMKACEPTRQNWCTAENAPTVQKSPTSTCPARVAQLAKMLLLPTWQSWAMWEPVMKKLSSPTVVRPPPCSVPRCMVQLSRTTLRLPMRSRVGAPLNLRSWGPMPRVQWA